MVLYVLHAEHLTSIMPSRTDSFKSSRPHFLQRNSIMIAPAMS